MLISAEGSALRLVNTTALFLRWRGAYIIGRLEGSRR
jgi:hypothetical protein